MILRAGMPVNQFRFWDFFIVVIWMLLSSLNWVREEWSYLCAVLVLHVIELSLLISILDVWWVDILSIYW